MRSKLNEIISVMHSIGDAELDRKLYEECQNILLDIGYEEIYDLKDEVMKLLSSSDEFIRDEAVAILGSPNRLHLPEFKVIAYDIWLNDESDMVRVTALSAWCGYYRQSKNKEVLEKLYSVVNNETFKINMRLEAYRGIFSTISFRHPDYDPIRDFSKLLRCKSHADFNKNVKWSTIRDIMLEYAPGALKDENK